MSIVKQWFARLTCFRLVSLSWKRMKWPQKVIWGHLSNLGNDIQIGQERLNGWISTPFISFLTESSPKNGIWRPVEYPDHRYMDQNYSARRETRSVTYILILKVFNSFLTVKPVLYMIHTFSSFLLAPFQQTVMCLSGRHLTISSLHGESIMKWITIIIS